jgi:hypothetical protein
LEEKEVVGSACDIPPDIEEEIVQHVLKLQQCLFGVAPK